MLFCFKEIFSGILATNTYSNFIGKYSSILFITKFTTVVVSLSSEETDGVSVVGATVKPSVGDVVVGATVKPSVGDVVVGGSIGRDIKKHSMYVIHCRADNLLCIYIND